jgi:transcriptional regulator with XRE-family HTH domain
VSRRRDAQANAEELRLLLSGVEKAVRTGKLPASHELPSLGQTLRQQRSPLRKTQEQAAREAGVSVAEWRRWETERAVPTVEQLARAGQVLGIEGDSSWELLRLHRFAPRRVLARELEQERALLVARSVGEQPDPDAAGRRLRNMDPGLREAVRAWCRQDGRGDGDGDVARALEEAQALAEREQERWILKVNAILRDIEDSQEEEGL